MNFATTTQDKYEQQLLISNSTNTTRSPTSTLNVFTTASNEGKQQSCENDFGRKNSELMNKSIETSASCTEWDEKEEEKQESISLLQRRESLLAVKTNAALDESTENSTSITPRLPLINLKAANDETQIDDTSDAAVVLTINDNNNSSKNSALETTEIDPQNSTDTSFNESNASADNTTGTTSNVKQNKTPSPNIGQRCNSSTNLKGVIQKVPSNSKLSNDSHSFSNTFNVSSSTRADEDSVSKSSDTSGELTRSTLVQDNSIDKYKSTSRLSERAKKKSWYNVICPNYKSRSQDFKKLFKEVPSDERLIVDYSCAWQRDILVQGRLYVSQNYVCFHANIFRWETYLSIKWKDVTAITKEKTALVIPNAISISTAKEKYFFATFAARDKSYLMLFRVWQNTLLNKPMLPQEMWQWVHSCYGDELGLTTDDEDYIDPNSITKEQKETEDESELEFVSATDETSTSFLLLEKEGDNEDLQQSIAESTFSTNLDIGDIGYRQFGVNIGVRSGIGSLTNSTISIGYNLANITKSIRKSHSSSSTTTTSGSSDNKTSDNNSSADRQINTNNYNNNNKNNNNSSISRSLSGGGVGENTSGIIMKANKTIASEEDASAAGSAQSGFNGTHGGIVDSTEGTLDTSTVAEYKSTIDGKRKVSKNNRQRDEGLNKNAAETLPTDMSDSSDSDENKMPFVVTAECNSTHEGRQLVHTILPINIDTLFNLLFSKSKFLTDFHEMRKSTDTSFGDWQTNEQGQRTRTVALTVQLSASVGPKTSKVTENQVMRDCSKPGELYSIDINTVNAGIPYADSFSVLLHYCFVRTIDDHTMLSVHAQIKYTKSVWGVVKGLIEKNTWVGLEDFYTSLLHALQSETNIPPAKGKGRRPRRGTPSLVRSHDDSMPSVSAKPDNLLENVLTTANQQTLLQQKQQQQQQHTPVHKVIECKNTNRYKWLSIFVIVLMSLLILLNVILLFKLWELEERIEDDYKRVRIPNLAIMKELPNTPQDWMEVVRQQELLHETELKKWHRVLQTAIELLKKTEKTLAKLMFR